MSETTHWRKLFNALLGRVPAAQSVPEPQAAEFGMPALPEPASEPGGMESRIRALELDIEDRDRQIERMRQEYAALQASRERDAGAAGQEQFARFFKKLTGALSNLDALATYQESGREVSPADFAALVRSLDREFAKAGLERIGSAGENAAFDIAVHQRMSGAAVRNGAPVTVRLPGYRLGAQVLLKAMVSGAEEESHG